MCVCCINILKLCALVLTIEMQAHEIQLTKPKMTASNELLYYNLPACPPFLPAAHYGGGFLSFLPPAAIRTAQTTFLFIALTYAR